MINEKPGRAMYLRDTDNETRPELYSLVVCELEVEIWKSEVVKGEEGKGHVYKNAKGAGGE
jgi:hypothetical protein